MHKIYTMAFARVYPLYLTKVQKKGRTKDELDQVIRWLTGFSQEQIDQHITDGTDFTEFFAQAHLHPNVGQITGVICGVRIEEIEEPLMQQIRYMDKLVDELAKGRPLTKILRA